MRVRFLLYLLVFVPGVAGAEQMVGNWFVTIEKDPFSTKKKSIAALADVTNHAGVLAVRCFPERGLSTILLMQSQKKFDPHTKVPFKYRADDGEITEDEGEAFGEDGAVELPNNRQILADAGKAKRIYIRVTDPTESTFDITFAPRLSSRALAQINTDCPASDEKRSEGAGDDAVHRALGSNAPVDVTGGTGRTWTED